MRLGLGGIRRGHRDRKRPRPGRCAGARVDQMVHPLPGAEAALVAARGGDASRGDLEDADPLARRVRVGDRDPPRAAVGGGAAHRQVAAQVDERARDERPCRLHRGDGPAPRRTPCRSRRGRPSCPARAGPGRPPGRSRSPRPRATHPGGWAGAGAAARRSGRSRPRSAPAGPRGHTGRRSRPARRVPLRVRRSGARRLRPSRRMPRSTGRGRSRAGSARAPARTRPPRPAPP